MPHSFSLVYVRCGDDMRCAAGGFLSSFSLLQTKSVGVLGGKKRSQV
jgi:hypothetical protein